MSSLLNRLLKDWPSLFGVIVFTMTMIAALAAAWVAPFAPDEQFFDGLTLEGAPLPPNERFWLGTGLLGRDLLSRLIYGARTSLIIGIVANGVAVLIGAVIGVTAGYLGGWIGGAIMRFTDLMMAFPALLLAIALSAIFSPSLWIALPSALPYLFAAAKLAVPRALLGVMIAEWLATGRGLGTLMNQSRGFLDYGMIWTVAIVSVLILGGLHMDRRPGRIS